MLFDGLDLWRAVSWADLEEANLRGADLRRADLEEANLRGADLRRADLEKANLRGANLRRANLRGADLEEANLRGADLWGADLEEANLRGANLRRADLWGANLRGADLEEANLEGADLEEANLEGADLEEANLPAYERLPQTGAFTAFKGCVGHVVRLRVPADAGRISALCGPKCRVAFAEVEAVLDETGDPCGATEAASWYDGETVYREGECVEPDDWDPDIRVECSHGIHCYPTKREAVGAVQ